MGEMLRDFLCSSFPKPRSLPSKKFMSAESYDILGKRNMYKKLLTSKRKELRRAELREAFVKLAGHSCGALGYQKSSVSILPMLVLLSMHMCSILSGSNGPLTVTRKSTIMGLQRRQRMPLRLMIVELSTSMFVDCSLIRLPTIL